MLTDVVEPQLITDLAYEDTAHLVGVQANTATYLLPPQDLSRLPDRTYFDTKSLWEAILREKLRATVTLTLKDFLVFEWFPRSPGLFYTHAAELARQTAMNFVLSTPRDTGLTPGLDIDDAAIYQNPGSTDFMYVFNPYGKASMLKGGIGSVRLKPRPVASQRVWFMSACSGHVAHEGFPIALPEYFYARYIERIAEEGALRCSLTGTLQFFPETLEPLFGDYVGVPQLYLLVSELHPASPLNTQQIQALRVSVAVSFQSSYEGRSEMYASYVTFCPGREGSLTRRVYWLENSYVKGMYDGHVVTDFDETMKQFSHATFSLQKVMNLQLNEEEVKEWAKSLGMSGNIAGLLARQVQIGKVTQTYINVKGDYVEQKDELHTGSRIEVNAPQSQIGAVGDHSTGTVSGALNINANAIKDLDIAALQTALQSLYTGLNQANLSMSTLIAAQSATGAALSEGIKDGKVNSEKLVSQVKNVGDTLTQAKVAVQAGTSLWESVQKLANTLGPLVGGARIVLGWFGVPIPI